MGVVMGKRNHGFTQNDLGALAELIRSTPQRADEAMSLAINKGATLAVRESIDRIVANVTLDRGYVNQHLKTVSRAKPDNLRAVIQARARETLTGRFNYAKTPGGVRLQVNRSGGYREIKKGWVARNLKGSGGTSIAMRVDDAIAAAKDSMHKGAGATPGKMRKLRRLITRKRTNRRKGSAMQVTHSRSINQLFTDVRLDVQPVIERQLAIDFINAFKRKIGR